MNFYGKIKAFSPARLLLITLIIVVLSSLVDRYLLNELGQDFDTIYQDRLIPAVEMFHINHQIYEKKLAAEKYLVKPSRELKEEYYEILLSTDRKIDSLIADFETTYLVKEEIDHLGKLKHSIQEARYVERDFLMGAIENDNLLQNELFPIYEHIRMELLNLVNIQQKVGGEIKQQNKQTWWTVNQISTLKVGFAVILALMINNLFIGMKPKNDQEILNFRNN